MYEIAGWFGWDWNDYVPFGIFSSPKKNENDCNENNLVTNNFIYKLFINSQKIQHVKHNFNFAARAFKFCLMAYVIGFPCNLSLVR